MKTLQLKKIKQRSAFSRPCQLCSVESCALCVEGKTVRGPVRSGPAPGGPSAAPGPQLLGSHVKIRRGLGTCPVGSVVVELRSRV